MRRALNVALVAGLLAGLAAVGVASSADTPAPRSAPGARELVGTVERVEAVLGYLDAERSTTLRYPGADYVKVHVGRLLLLPGDYLTVSDPSGAEVHRAGSGWATSITGDTAVVTLHRAQPDPLGLRTEVARLGVTIDKVARGLLPDDAAPPPSTGREESVCGRDESRDAVCYRSRYPAIYRNTKPVARLLIDGVELCTAFRVGPRNRLLTNHHCLSTAAQAQRTEVWFNYQCAQCDGWAVFRPTKVRGEQVLDTDGVLDYTLFTVDDFPKVERFGYLELDPRPAEVGEELYVPQHPRGLPTRVAMRSDRDSGGRCAVTDPQVHGYGLFTDMAYYCDTDGGSSGSPVLSRTTHRVIALHHFGGCPNSGIRMELLHPRISSSI
jgi:hypothetical protein